jgi:hypothetical protein
MAFFKSSNLERKYKCDNKVWGEIKFVKIRKWHLSMVKYAKYTKLKRRMRMRPKIWFFFVVTEPG